MKEIIIIAGPNGAGKTSFANAYFPFAREGLLFVNADEIARDIADGDAVNRDLRAGKEMLRRIELLACEGTEFMFETTLASLSYAQKIPRWQQAGYHVSLIYLRLPTVDESIERVARRVRLGGTEYPRRSFGRGLRKASFISTRSISLWLMTGRCGIA